MRTALLVLLALAATTWATPYRDGANHHLGDDSFVAKFGRAPTPRDPEPVRMHVHLEYVRALLAAAPATRPDLEPRRAELLRYLGDYIAAGITPENSYVAHRSPVFIDARGNLCAVGYLIERSAGRDLPERIAAAHRLDYLEDIAAAMPEVADWVATSGFTLTELASIQPGYNGPDVMHMDGFDTATATDGAYTAAVPAGTFTGQFAHQQMTGAWKLGDVNGAVLGSGTFHAGAGTWTSWFADGHKLARGDFDHSRAEGEWRVYFESGRLAAVGPMHEGRRDGTWTFYYDAKGTPKLSIGRFDKGEVVGSWKHYDASGNLVATASGHPWGHLLLSIEPGADGVRHDIDQGEPAERYRLDAFYLGSDRLYIRDRSTLYDGDGNALDKVDGVWTARACTWSKARARAAKSGDTTALYMSFTKERWDASEKDANGDCSGDAKPVATGKAARLDKMLASRAQTHAAIPPSPFGVTTAPVERYEDNDASADAGRDNDADMATYLADHMAWYMEWPHVDDPFVALYASVPGNRVNAEFSAGDAKQMH